MTDSIEREINETHLKVQVCDLYCRYLTYQNKVSTATIATKIDNLEKDRIRSEKEWDAKQSEFQKEMQKARELIAKLNNR